MVLALFFFQLQEQLVCRAFHAVPTGLRIIQQVHNRGKVFIILFALMVQVQDQRRDQRRLCFLPEWVAAVCVFRRCVPHQQRHEPDHIRIRMDIIKRVIAVRAPPVRQVEYLDIVTSFQKQRGAVTQQLTGWVAGKE